jgi:hypothetical protein
MIYLYSMVRNTKKTEIMPIRVSPETAHAFRQFAEERDMTQEKALKKLLEKGGPLIEEGC